METVDEDLTYNDLFVRFPEESNTSIGAAYEAIEQILAEAANYFQVKSFVPMIFNCVWWL